MLFKFYLILNFSQTYPGFTGCQQILCFTYIGNNQQARSGPAEEEREEDILKLGGVGQADIYDAVIDTTKSRFSWLLVNLLTAVVASIVIGFFQASIEKVVALAVLMPIVASMGGNAGTQPLTVSVRALATKELTPTNALRIIFKETFVGGINGLIFAILVGVLSSYWFGETLLGLIIALAMILNLIIAGFAGTLIPITLHKYKI